MNMPVGGRGKKAPYKTVVVRVPEPIADAVEQLAKNYRDAVSDGKSGNEFTKITSSDECHRNELRYDDVKLAMTNVLKLKKGTKVSFDKLLQVLFPE
jgi:hypothetical protein